MRGKGPPSFYSTIILKAIQQFPVNSKTMRAESPIPITKTAPSPQCGPGDLHGTNWVTSSRDKNEQVLLGPCLIHAHDAESHDTYRN